MFVGGEEGAENMFLLRACAPYRCKSLGFACGLCRGQDLAGNHLISCAGLSEGNIFPARYSDCVHGISLCENII